MTKKLTSAVILGFSIIRGQLVLYSIRCVLDGEDRQE
jgi:hypothetical protein